MDSASRFTAPSPYDASTTDVLSNSRQELITGLSGEALNRAPKEGEVVLVNIAEVRRRLGL